MKVIVEIILNTTAMKTTTFICALISCFVAFSQTHTITLVSKITECAPVTQRLIQNMYTFEQREKLEKDVRKLNKLNYVMAYSYRFSEGQMVLKSQKQLFDAKQYDKYRMTDRTVVIFDALTGLNVELLSWSEIEKMVAQIELQCDIVLCD